MKKGNPNVSKRAAPSLDGKGTAGEMIRKWIVLLGVTMS